MENNSSFNISQDYEILPPKKDKAYPIPKIEWEYLKDRIRKIGDILNFYYTAGAILLGFSGSAFINLFTNDFKNEQENLSTKFIICLSIAVLTLLVGGISFFFGKQQKKMQTVASDDVIKHMEIIENRYEDLNEDVV
ncbi:MAG: hypothetical protein KAS17_03760 [Victivallaceae bacterium]|nr:hypothetical protein [Victivallaceae bacterium]